MSRLSVRDAIIERMDEFNLTPVDLVRRASLECAPSTIYRFVNGESELKTDLLDRVFDVLNLDITKTGGKPRWVGSPRIRTRRIKRCQ